MIDPATLLILMALTSVGVAWAVPSKWALDAVGAWTAVIMTTIAPASALWLLSVAILTPLALVVGDRTRHRDAVAAIWAVVLLAVFVTARLTHDLLWVGGAFFTLRALHVLGDWWMGKLKTPSIRAHLRYQLFLPVIVSGPIHRTETFERQARRRRWDPAMFFGGMERALIGAFSAYVVGGYIIWRVADRILNRTEAWPTFFREWARSVAEWISLYFTFAGFTSIALGIALMIGLRLEENFDRPWAARNLIEFWMRWHITLTRWCRDYVFRPVAAVTRSAAAGLVLAILAIGLWHEFSIYYMLWSIWQVLGVALTRVGLRWLPTGRIPEPLRAVFGPASVLAWLSLARPVIHRLQEILA